MKRFHAGHRLLATVILAVLGFIFLARIPPGQVPKIVPRPLGPEPLMPYSDEFGIIDATNEARIAANVTQLVPSDRLMEMSQAWADRMAREGRMRHPSGSEWARESAGFIGWSENVAWGYEDGPDVVRGWLTSDGHRANMLDPKHRLIGVGRNGKYWVQRFAAGER